MAKKILMHILLITSLLLLTMNIATAVTIRFNLTSEEEVNKIINQYDWKTSPADLLKNWKKGIPVVWTGKVLEMKLLELEKQVEIIWICQYVKYINPEKTSAFSSKLAIDENVNPISFFSVSLITNIPIEKAKELVERKEKYYLEVVGISDGINPYHNTNAVVLRINKLREIAEKDIQTTSKTQEDSTKFPAGIIFGAKAAYMIDAPNGWVLDTKSGLPKDLPCVIYPKNKTWDTTPIVIYAKLSSPEYTQKDEFIRLTIENYKKADSKFSFSKVIDGKTKEGFNYTIYQYIRPSISLSERVAYVQLPESVAYIVYSSFESQVFNKYFDTFANVINSFKYRSDIIKKN
jgi:hypothetical protein